jgi:hypothetical protein
MVHQLWFYMHWVGYFPFIHRTRLLYLNTIFPKYERLSSAFPKLRRQENRTEPEATAQKENVFKESIFEVSRFPIHFH